MEALIASHRELKEAIEDEREDVEKFVEMGRVLVDEENCDKEDVSCGDRVVKRGCARVLAGKLQLYKS